MCVQILSIIQNLFDIKMRTKISSHRPLFTQRNDDVIVGHSYVSEIPAEMQRIIITSFFLPHRTTAAALLLLSCYIQ